MRGVSTIESNAEPTDDAGSARPADPEPDQPPQPAPCDNAQANPPALDLLNAEKWLCEAEIRWLSEMSRRALRELKRGDPKVAGGEVRARLVGDTEMSRLHLEFLDDPATTDVLTFDHTNDPNAALDVDLALCVDEARRQASAHNIELKHELLLYLVHGVLHCVGYDDRTPAESDRMHRREDDVLRAIGAGAVYTPDRSDSGDTQ